ncbi:prepilin peptidase [Georhizobium sp. MAB10]|uniref:prepilin peptidase n=1 Tax=Georhizobium sp. MAB10 TaxID=3028319 RepID=UPI00385585CD
MSMMSRAELIGIGAGAAGLALVCVLAVQGGVDPTWPFALWLGALCLAIAVEDVRQLRVADSASTLLFAGGCAWQVSQAHGEVFETLMLALLACAICGGALFIVRALHARITGRIGLGLGDVKFCGAAAAWTGLSGFPFMLLLASLTALVVVGLLSVSRFGWGRQRRLPFASFLAPALFMVWLASVPFTVAFPGGVFLHR